MNPKDNDELRDYEQYVHWQFVALLRSLRLSANLSPAQEQLIKAKARLVAATIGEDISTHVVRARLDELLQMRAAGERYAAGNDVDFEGLSGTYDNHILRRVADLTGPQKEEL